MSAPMNQPPASPLLIALLRRSVSGSGLNNIATSPSMMRRNTERDALGRYAVVGGSEAAYQASLISHYAEDLERRRRAERTAEESRSADNTGSDNLKIDSIELYARDNAREHRTDRYEATRDGFSREMGSSSPMGLSMSLSMSNVPSMSSNLDHRHQHYSTAVVRRGQPFFMAVRMKDRNFDARRDILRVTLSFGPNPQVTKGTKVVLPFRTNQREFTRAPQKWDIRLHQQEGSNITFQIHIPANAPVGLWRVTIETSSNNQQGARVDEFRFKDDLYIIFNPFCRDDPVYLDNEEARREYVMNENGKIYVGTYNRPKGRRWVFGQFSDVALPAAQVLLDQSGLNPTERGNPVQVVRAIASIINAREGFGLLEGKWEGSFEDGVCPWSWTGSSKIFEHYLRNGSKPVKYGQCWVYAAVATSLFRALGIPARPVTNFVSARDTNHTMSVDKYFDVFGEELRGGPNGDSQDALWNFHAWTEVWMSRPDLPSGGYNGWQAVDATPHPQHLQLYSGDQKQRGPLSSEDFRRGPTSVEAVRRGEIGLAFDTAHLIAEVNAEINHFQEDESSHWGFRKARINNYFVGRQILTKRAGADDDVADADVEDITNLYKSSEGASRYQMQTDNFYSSSPFYNQGQSSPYGDKSIRDRDRDMNMMHYSDRPMSLVPGSPADRMSCMNAARGVERGQQLTYDNRPVNEDVFFDLIEQEKIAYGQPFNVQVHIQNRSQETRTINAVLTANSVFYTGVFARRLGRTECQFVLQPGTRETIQIRVGWEDYRDKIVDYGHIKIYGMASVQETKQLWSEENDFQLEKPKLDVQIRGTPQVGQDCFVTFSFMNPVPVTLTECDFTFEGAGLARPQTVKYRDVKQGEMVSFVQKFTPRFSGERKLVATFNSRELGDIVGSRPIHVRD